MKHPARLFPLLLAVILPPALASADIPSTASRYAIASSAADHKHDNGAHHPTRHWTVWRSANRVEMQQDNAPYAVAWTRLPSGRLSRTEIHHAYRTVVNYAPTDAKLMGMTQRWQWTSGLFDGALIKALTHQGPAMHNSLSGELYTGTVNQLDYRVIWLNDIAIPALIDIRGPHQSERIELLETHPATTAPYTKVDWQTDYDDIDYVDLGDLEAHPLVRAIHRGQTEIAYPGHHH